MNNSNDSNSNSNSNSNSDNEKDSIVIVDDNPNNLQVLSSILQLAGFKVRPALSGEIALRAIGVSAPDLVLLDIRMPGMDGYETCRRLKADAVTRDIPVIFISALTETADKLAAFRAGGVDYVSKPFQAEEVLARVRTHLQLRHMQRQLESQVAERTAELRVTCDALRESQGQYRRMLEQTIQAIAFTIEKRDPYTAGHQARVSQLAVAIAQKLGLSPDQIDGIRLGGMIHDLGKISVPAEILSRPGRLTDTELMLVKSHSEVGGDILRQVEFPWPVKDMILQHHERLDGSGYPNGLRGDEILLEARILAVADVVEAMASHRPYRAALGIEKALDELRCGSGRLYDPDVCRVCLRLFETEGYLL
ncbi:MAG: two-component system response regulator, partial [Burkholderiales bacterium RIFOXYD12_FULL_59_19]